MEMPATDLTPVLDRLDALAAQVAYLAERQRAQEDLVAEMMPIAREAMATAIARLDALDKDGTIAFASELADVVRRIVEGFSPGDVRQLGDSIVGILEIVRAVTQPDVLHVEPIGMLGVVRATRKEDVRKGLAVLMEMLRRVGQHAAATAPSKQLDHQARLAAMPGPRRARPQLPAPAAAPACATPVSPATADAAWTRAKAEGLAAAQSLTLTDAHWTVIDAARADFAASQVSPNIRRLTQIAGVTTRDLYALFPKAPGRAIAAIAGLPKPAGCL